MPETPVGPADAIKALRAELSAAMLEGKDKELQFKLGPVQMEFGVEVSNEKGGEAGIHFWVVSLGGKGSATSSVTHRIQLELQPLGSGGKDFVINDTVDKPVTGFE